MEIIQNFDNAILNFLNDFAQSTSGIKWLSIGIAQYLIYIVPLAFIIFWFWPNLLKKGVENIQIRKDLIFTFILGVIGWQILSKIIGMIYVRERPFEGLLGASELIFHRPTYSFPSDHAIFLFTIAFTLISLKYFKVGKLFLVLAVLISIARVMVAVHWPTDVIAGAILGYILTYVGIMGQKQITKSIVEPIFWLAKQIKLT